MKTSSVESHSINAVDLASCCANFLHNEAHTEKLRAVRSWLVKGPENVFSAEVELSPWGTVTLRAGGVDRDFSVCSVTVHRSPYVRSLTSVRWGGKSYDVAIQS